MILVHRIFLLLTLSMLLTACDGHWEQVEKTKGYQGKARVNPFLAAQRMLEELGHEPERRMNLGIMPDTEAVIFLSGEGGVSEGRARQLTNWVRDGGHLIYCLSGCRAYNDHASGVELGMAMLENVLEQEGDPLLDEFGIELKKWDTDAMERSLEAARKKLEEKTADTKQPEKAAPEKKDTSDKADKDKAALKPPEKLNDLLKEAGKMVDALHEDLMAEMGLDWNGRHYKLKLAGFHALKVNRPLDAEDGEFVVGERENAAAVHLEHGLGYVTVLTHARPFRNRWLTEHDHAEWLDALIAGGNDRAREVFFVAAATASFTDLLWERGWMVVIMVVVCIAFWLWRHMPRFGPLSPVQLDETRHFSSHVASLGHFYWRRRRPDVLVQAAREAVWEILRTRHASIDAHTRHLSDALAASIATRCNLPVERVNAAFDMPAPHQAHNLIPLLRDLQTMRTQL
jgi:hypothetical protein